MKRDPTFRKLCRLLREHGMAVERNRGKGGHFRVVRLSDDRVVYTLPCSPAIGYYAENAVAEMVRRGLLPPDARSVRMR